MLRASLSIVVTSACLFLACGSGSSSPPPQSAPAGGAAAGCGLRMFPAQPQCEAQLDAQCCAPQQACGNDADCQKAIACLVACNDEAAEKKKTGQPGACACMQPCFQQLQGRAGALPFQEIINCTQRGFDGMGCGSQC
jgi:hypothetical protein